VRQIAPEMFQPMLGDPNAPSHKPPPPPAPAPAPKAVAAPPPPPPVVVAPSRERPYGACEPAARDWTICLGDAAQLADREVEQAERSVLAGLEGRVNPVMADGAARGLRAAGDAWRVLRDRECADLPLIETGLTGSLYERRLMCRIRRDVERVEVLRERYGAEG
jgi:uncharacterized protein YecT (DUF1311 family)